MKFICGVNYAVQGIEKLPEETPYIVLPNHQSFWENVFLQLIIPEHSWVVKKELFNIPIFGPGLRLMDPIAVDRAKSRSIMQILDQGLDKIRSGVSLIIFPEGTRVKTNVNVKLKPSAAKLALAAKVPVVIIVHNAGIFWPKGFWIKKPGTIDVKIVEVISKEALLTFKDPRELTNYLEKVMHLEKNKLIV